MKPDPAIRLQDAHHSNLGSTARSPPDFCRAALPACPTDKPTAASSQGIQIPAARFDLSSTSASPQAGSKTIIRARGSPTSSPVSAAPLKDVQFPPRHLSLHRYWIREILSAAGETFFFPFFSQCLPFQMREAERCLLSSLALGGRQHLQTPVENTVHDAKSKFAVQSHGSAMLLALATAFSPSLQAGGSPRKQQQSSESMRGDGRQQTAPRARTSPQNSSAAPSAGRGGGEEVLGPPGDLHGFRRSVEKELQC